MKTIASLLLASGLIGAGSARAQPLIEPSSGVTFERSPTIDGKTYLCLGTGIRKKALLKVYAVAYCVEEQAGGAAIERYFAEGPGRVYAPIHGAQLADDLGEDPGLFRALMAMPVEKVAELVFVRDAGKDKMKDAFEESLTKALGAKEKPRIDAFVKLLDRDLKRGDRLMLHTKPGGELRLGLTGKLFRTLEDPFLANAIWEPYLGKDSVAPELKTSIARSVAEMRK